MAGYAFFNPLNGFQFLLPDQTTENARMERAYHAQREAQRAISDQQAKRDQLLREEIAARERVGMAQAQAYGRGGGANLLPATLKILQQRELFNIQKKQAQAWATRNNNALKALWDGVVPPKGLVYDFLNGIANSDWFSGSKWLKEKMAGAATKVTQEEREAAVEEVFNQMHKDWQRLPPWMRGMIAPNSKGGPDNFFGFELQDAPTEDDPQAAMLADVIEKMNRDRAAGTTPGPEGTEVIPETPTKPAAPRTPSPGSAAEKPSAGPTKTKGGISTKVLTFRDPKTGQIVHAGVQGNGTTSQITPNTASNITARATGGQEIPEQDQGVPGERIPLDQVDQLQIATNNVVGPTAPPPLPPPIRVGGTNVPGEAMTNALISVTNQLGAPPPAPSIAPTNTMLAPSGAPTTPLPTLPFPLRGRVPLDMGYFGGGGPGDIFARPRASDAFTNRVTDALPGDVIFGPSTNYMPMPLDMRANQPMPVFPLESIPGPYTNSPYFPGSAATPADLILDQLRRERAFGRNTNSLVSPAEAFPWM